MKTKVLLALVALLFIISSCKKNDPITKTTTDKAAGKRLTAGPPSGVYKIINGTTFNADANRALEIAGVSLNNGAKAQQWDFFPNNGQLWWVVDQGNGYYKIMNGASLKMLDVPGGTNVPGTQLHQWEENGNDAQLWKIDYLGFGVYKITSKVNNLVVTLENNMSTNGAKILQRPDGENGQFWLFLPDYLPADNTTPTKTITWAGTSTQLSHSGPQYAEYGRVHRINSTNLICSYHYGASVYGDDIGIRRSTDNGATWLPVQSIVHTAGYWGFSTPETIVLQNGWIILAYVGRGNPDDNAHDNVQIRVSQNGGVSWGAAQIVTSGRSWEPAMVQLADGEIEMFYSSEALWTPTWSQQQILMVRSKNNGSTWTAPQQVAYTSGKRDGMPVPLLLQDNKGIVFPIESVGSAQSAWMNWSSIYSKWRYADGVGSTANTRRWLATTGSIWGGGPYLVQSAAGNTILSVHDKDGRGNTDWRYNTMLVTVGNTMAKNFVNVSRPWPGLPVTEGAINNSLFMKDATHVMAVTSRTYTSPSAHSAVYWKQGTIN